VVFGDPRVLKRLHPLLLHHAVTTFGSADVMRFLGHKLPLHGGVNGNFVGEVPSDLRRREEGIRIKHRVNGNSVKTYSKALRVEGVCQHRFKREPKPSRSRGPAFDGLIGGDAVSA
jgi:hypothetical protein